MTEQTMWVLVIIVAAIVAAGLGFWTGRRSTGGGARQRITELEKEVAQNKEELNHYRQDVKEHFDHTATLFASMAGSYRELFDHLSQGYESLAGGSATELAQAKVDMLLQDAEMPSQIRIGDVRNGVTGEAQPVTEEKAAPVSLREPSVDAPAPGGEAADLPVIEGEAIVEEIVSRPAAAEELFRVEENIDADLPLVTDVVPEPLADDERREPSIPVDGADGAGSGARRSADG